MLKVLVVTYYWPPAGGPGVQRWLYFVRYLREFGVDPVLYVPERPHYPITDPQLGELVPGDLTIYRCSFWEPYRLANLLSRRKTRRISSGIIERDSPGALERFLLWVRGNLFIPDARKFWVKKARKQLAEILEREGISILITTGPPHSLHLIGLDMKARVGGLRWVADFRDPWTDIGYHSALRLGSRARNRHARLEKLVLRGADTVLATSRHTRDALAAHTPKPVRVITNGYDGDVAGGGQPEGKFILAHVGSLLSGRNPEALWASLARMLRDVPGFDRDLRIELTGLVSPEAEAHLRNYGLTDYLIKSPYVPHADAIRRQRRAQVLLLLEIDAPETRGIVPGKLFEYMAAARPILAIGPVGWEAARMVEEAACGAGFGHGQNERIFAQLVEWYDLYRQGALRINPAGILRYHRRALTEKLASDVLWELSSGNPS